MKFPLMLRVEHELEIEDLKQVEKLLRIDKNNLKHKCMELDDRNCELSVKLTAATVKANKYEGWYNDLTYLYRNGQNDLNDKSRELIETTRELESYKKKVEGLEKLYSEYKGKNDIYKADIERLGRVYNNMNRKLWCNEEVKRQLRKLVDEIRDAEKVNKNEIAKYLEGLSMIAGGGEPFEFIGLSGDENAKG